MRTRARVSPSVRRVVREPRALAGVGSAALQAQLPSPFATRVVSFDTRGNAGGGVFQSSNLLGAPRGGGLAQGSLHVHSLGIGGEATLGFDVTIVDGPGCDLIVSENAFLASG